MVELVGLVFIGIFSGIVSGMTGASGVMVLIPILTSVFGAPLFVAIGTSLMADVIASGPIAVLYYKARNFNVRAALFLGLGAIVGTQIGTSHVVFVPENLIMIGVSLAMIGLGIRMMRGSVRNVHIQPSWTKKITIKHDVLRSLLSLAIGLLLGIMTGFFGAGGGILVFLILYFVFNFDLKTSIGTAAGVMLISAFAGAWGYWGLGNVDVRIGFIVGISAMIGGIASAHIAHRIDEDVLSRYVGILFTLLAIVMLAVRFLGA